MTEQRRASGANATLRLIVAVRTGDVSLSFGDPATPLDAR
jgi:hypothetical protein